MDVNSSSKTSCGHVLVYYLQRDRGERDRYRDSRDRNYRGGDRYGPPHGGPPPDMYRGQFLIHCYSLYVYQTLWFLTIAKLTLPGGRFDQGPPPPGFFGNGPPPGPGPYFDNFPPHPSHRRGGRGQFYYIIFLFTCQLVGL